MPPHPNNSIFIGKILHHYDIVESTNALAFDLVTKNNPIEGTAISSHFQSHGRGQIGRFWSSEAQKNILTSIILTPRQISLKDQFYLNIVASLAICDVLESLGIVDGKIKWPNDIYIEDQKVCGILVQSLLEKSIMKYAIIGLGLNVNQKSWPDEIPNPISMSQYLGKDLDIEDVRSELFLRLEYRYLSLKRGRYSDLKSEYLELLYQKDQFCPYESDKNSFYGTIRDIDEAGRLLIEDSEGLLTAYNFREITYK